jgi:hypothetical protein
VRNQRGAEDPSPASGIRHYSTSLLRSAHLPSPRSHTMFSPTCRMSSPKSLSLDTLRPAQPTQRPSRPARREKTYRPAPIGQGRRLGDAHIVGYYAQEQRGKPREALGDRGGAEHDPANELPRIPIPRTPVNNSLVLQAQTCSQIRWAVCCLPWINMGCVLNVSRFPPSSTRRSWSTPTQLGNELISIW